MRRACFSVCLVLAAGLGTAFVVLRQSASMAYAQTQGDDRIARIPRPQAGFDLEVLVDGRPLAEYFAHGRTYVEALKGAEFELRVRNPTPNRVAVALSVDGLNTIDARHTSAWSRRWRAKSWMRFTVFAPSSAVLTMMSRPRLIFSGSFVL